MKIEDKRIDYKFLNLMLYVGFAIVIFYVLKNIGIMDKIIEVLIALIPIFLGVILCWIAQPFVNKLRKIGFSKTLSAFITLIIIFGVLILVISLIIPIFITQFTNLIKDLPTLYDTLRNTINPFLIDKLHLNNGMKSFQDVISSDVITLFMKNIFNYSISTIQSIANIAITIGTVIVVSFFLIKDMDIFKERIIAFFSKNKKGNKRYKMLTDIDNMITSYVKGSIIDGIIVGILVFVVCTILGIKYSVVFGILTAILNLIPYIGAILSEILVTIYAFMTGGPVFAVITFISLLSVQIIDANILQPNIIAKSVNLHPVVVIGGLIVFNLIFGVFGMIIAMPTLATIKIILEYKFSMQFDEIL